MFDRAVWAGSFVVVAGVAVGGGTGLLVGGVGAASDAAWSRVHEHLVAGSIAADVLVGMILFSAVVVIGWSIWGARRKECAIASGLAFVAGAWLLVQTIVAQFSVGDCLHEDPCLVYWGAVPEELGWSLTLLLIVLMLTSFTFTWGVVGEREYSSDRKVIM